MSRKVIVYTQVTCGPCQQEKNWLKENGVAFEERDVRANDAFFNEAIQLGASSTPVTLIEEENGDRSVIHGFDVDSLKQVLGLS
ncbi:glutaredoxin family protein [Brevibacillus dissolubilis]|uniref:glutaredoxin family protein n=1 Tax=Brevibacillus dissolubilis TaxID=1844116 RepID=UPI0011167AFC|nr:glutaredoxin family protein [Brevibacillus dissolubilis]